MVRYLKRLKSSKFVRVKAFPMYGGIGVSAPSLHRESTDSLILSCISCSEAVCMSSTLPQLAQNQCLGSTSSAKLVVWAILFLAKK